MSVMMPILITSPETWAWAGVLAVNAAAKARPQAAESCLSFIDGSC